MNVAENAKNEKRGEFEGFEGAAGAQHKGIAAPERSGTAPNWGIFAAIERKSEPYTR